MLSQYKRRTAQLQDDANEAIHNLAVLQKTSDAAAIRALHTQEAQVSEQVPSQHPPSTSWTLTMTSATPP
jgi:hypothetical protein